ncbi:MAG: ABC transporter substrate-binding protein [Deltaproteobacteria bacterium]|jgi:branched-chain amino acid transport system substrate-binding protein|nr:ABC transporter substrate-binding protein [Syntrophaceae bacterium]
MKKMRLFAGTILVFFLLVTGAGAAGPDTAGPIKIGLMGNMSAPFSLSAKGAATMAVDEINKAGGIQGRPVKLIVEDTKGEIPKCVEIYKKLVMNDRVLAVFIAEKVEMGVAGMEIGAELFPEYPHVFFCTIGSGDDIWHRVRDNYKKYRFGFQTYYAISTNYLKILAPDNIDCFKNQIKAKKVAIVYEDMEWTKPLRKGIPGVSDSLPGIYRAKGLNVVYETTTSLDQKMFNPIFEAIAKSGADLIDCVVGYIDQPAFIKQWSQSSARNIPVFIWGGLAGMPPAWKMTEGKVTGVMVGSSLVRVPITPKTIPFMDNLVKNYKVGPIFGSHTTYDTLYGFKKAIEKAGTTGNIDQLIKQLEQVEEVAVLGSIGWHPQYHYNLPPPKYITPIVQWQNGEMKVIYPLKYKMADYKSPQELRK